MTQAPSRLSKGYRYFALLFVIGSLWLLGAIAISLYGQAEITVVAAQNRTSGDFLITVQDLPFDAKISDPTVVPGKISEQVVEKSQPFPATGKMIETHSTIGSVTLVNTTVRSQTLVAITRVLSADGVLVRLKERVVVPALGQVVAAVYPDNPATFREVAAGRLTIPGLAAVLQDKIYAEAKTALRTGETAVSVVTPEDLELAKNKTVDAALNEAGKTFADSLNASQQRYSRLVQKEVLAENADAAVGERRDTFNQTVQLKVVTVAFDEQRLKAVVQQQLAKKLPFTHLLQEIDPKSLAYEMQRYDAERKVVTLKVYAEGRSALRSGSPMLDPTVVGGLTKEQIATHFQQYPEIKSVSVRFFPPSLRRAPRTPSRIKFIIQ